MEKSEKIQISDQIDGYALLGRYIKNKAERYYCVVIIDNKSGIFNNNRLFECVYNNDRNLLYIAFNKDHVAGSHFLEHFDIMTDIAHMLVCYDKTISENVKEDDEITLDAFDKFFINLSFWYKDMFETD